MENATDESSLLENPWMNVVDKEIKVLNLGEDAIVRLVYKLIRQLAAKQKLVNGGMYSYLRP
ncbi:hypothetical protein WN943_004737 [Citrus x changshan-huyou]